MAVRSFNDFMREQRGGETAEEMSKALKELIAAVGTTGKKGSLTLTITVEPVKKNNSGQVFVSDDVKLKKPVTERGSTLFFTTPENNLQRNDPRQQELPGIRDVSVNVAVKDATAEGPGEVANA